MKGNLFEDIFRRVQKDFDEKSLEISRHAMESVLHKCLVQAQKEAEEHEKAADKKTD